MPTPITVSELLYDFTGHLTRMVDYGIPLPAILSGQVPVPATGARFDAHVEGTATGPKLKAKVNAIDYLEMRADGLTRLHVHAHFVTDDGANIAFFADGIATPEPGSPILHLRENISLFTSAPAYAWLNTIQVWAQGTVNPPTGEIKIKAYVA